MSVEFVIHKDQLILNIDPGKYKLKITVPFPDNYPDTLFKMNNKKNIIAELICQYDKTDDDIYIARFFVYSSSSITQDPTKQERMLTKGLGRRMLCEAIHFGIDREWITPNGTISLEALATAITHENLHCSSEIMKQMKSSWTIEEIDEYLQPFHDSLQHEIIESVDDKISLICKRIQNRKLVAYYETYGLKELHDEHPSFDYTYMSGTIQSVLSECKKDSKKYGKKSKRKKVRYSFTKK